MTEATDLPDSHVYDLVVIGAGQAGLSAAGELARRGMTAGRDLLVLDAEDGPGGAWRHRWDSLTIGKAHRIADLPHFPAGELDESAPSSRAVADYYGSYERARGLDVLRPVRVQAVRSTDQPAPPLTLARGSAPAGDDAVTRPDRPVLPPHAGAVPSQAGVAGQPPAGAAGIPGEPATSGPGSAAPGGPGTAQVRRDTLLAVETQTPDGPRTFLTRMVISAAGTWTHPYVPYVPGIETFEGRQLHTHDYTRAEDLAGQRVVVVGGGLSAVQMILEIAPHVGGVVWATRRPPNFTDVTFDEAWGARVEHAVQERTGAGLRPASVVRTTGIPLWPAYVKGVQDGLLVSRGMFDRVRPDAVRFSPAATVADAAGLGPADRSGQPLVLPRSWKPVAEPTWVEADTIFWNTGFRAALTHLTPLRLREGEPGSGEVRGREAAASGIRMDGRVSVAADPRVLLVGYGDSASTLGATHAGALAARTALQRLG